MVVITNLGIHHITNPLSLPFFFQVLLNCWFSTFHFTHSFHKRWSFFKTCSRNALPVSILQTAGHPTTSKTQTFLTIKITMPQSIFNETFQKEEGCKGSNVHLQSVRRKWALQPREHSRKNSTFGLSTKVPVGFFSFHGYSSICWLSSLVSSSTFSVTTWKKLEQLLASHIVRFFKISLPNYIDI